MEELRKIQQDKYKRHVLLTETFPKLGNLICLDPIQLSAFRITIFLRKYWFKEQSLYPGIYTIRIKGKNYDLRDIGPFINDDDYMNNITTDKHELKRISDNFKRVSNIKYIQNIEYERSLTHDSRDDINNIIYIDYFVKSLKHIDNSLMFNILKDLIQSIIIQKNINIEIHFEKIAEYICENNFLDSNNNLESKILHKNKSNLLKLVKLKRWFIDFNLNNTLKPSWLLDDYLKNINNYESIMEFKIKNTIELILYNSDIHLYSDFDNKLKSCNSCFNNFEKKDLISFDSFDTDFLVCLECFNKLNNSQ